jgi:hypothetical protein
MGIAGVALHVQRPVSLQIGWQYPGSLCVGARAELHRRELSYTGTG